MIFEILFVLSLVVGIVLAIVNKVNQRSNEATFACVLVICVILAYVGIIVDSASKASVHSVHELKPLEYAKLQELSDKKYVIHSTNGKYYFMHDGTMDDASRVFIVSIEGPKYDEPTMIKCVTKPSIWRAFILSHDYNAICYVLVINNDQIIEQVNTDQITEKNNLPEWLSSHQGGFLMFFVSFYVVYGSHFYLKLLLQILAILQSNFHLIFLPLDKYHDLDNGCPQLVQVHQQ